MAQVYRTIMRVLQKASSDKQLRGNLDLEQYAWDNQMKMERRTRELQGKVSEMGKQLAAAIKALSANNTLEQIAKILNVDMQQVEEILKD